MLYCKNTAIIDPAHEIVIIIALATNNGSDKPAYLHRLARAFAACLHIKWKYSKTCLKWPLKKKTENCFRGQLSLNAGEKYWRMLLRSILQYFWPPLSYHLSLRSLFCLFWSGHLRQALLYVDLDTVNPCIKTQTKNIWASSWQNLSLGFPTVSTATDTS